MRKLLVILCLILAISIFTSCSVKSNSNTYAIINNEEITIEEIDYFKAKLRPNLINELSSEYNITDFSDFWNIKINDKTAEDILTEKALENAGKAKIKLILMRDYGIYDDISFSALKQKAEDYNYQYQNSKNHVGLNQINMDSFYTYYIDNGMLELVNLYFENDYTHDSEVIKQYKAQNTNSQNLSDISIEKDICKQKILEITENKYKNSQIIIK